MDEQNAKPSAWVRLTQLAFAALYPLLQPVVPLISLVVAMVLGLLSIFLGWRFALASLVATAVAIGFILAIGCLWIELLGCWLQRIYEQLLSLHDEEVAKLTKSQKRTEPEKPGPSWRM